MAGDSDETDASSVTQGSPLISAAGEGEPVSMGTSSFVLRARADQTAGRYTLVESSRVEVGSGPSLHLHTREDETFIVPDGRYRFFIRDEEVIGERGAVIFAPRDTPHRSR